MRAPVARTGRFRSAVQNELNGEVNINSLPLPVNLDSVSKGGQGGVRPTRTTVLRDMLIQVHGEVVHAIDVAPIKGVRD